MRRRFLLIAGALAVIIGGACWWLARPAPFVTPALAAALQAPGDVARGRAVFFAGGCAACHVSQGQPEGQVDHLKLGGGLELKSPYGSFFAPNISPDPEDGIGQWTAADLVNAMKSGVSPDGRHYFPAFPYTTYAHARVEDIRDLMAFLRTLQPVKGKAPPHRIAFAFNIRGGLGLWKRLFLDQTPLGDDATQPPEWNRGRYLVMALGHCAECHSARNFMGAINARYLLAGGPDLEGQGWVPNITQDKDGIADWSAKDIAYMLQTGDTPDGDSVGGSMTAVVRNMSQLSEADRNAIAAYIKWLPPRASPPRPPRKSGAGKGPG
jgi:mono/diheme cytochrome c family protein